MTCHVISGATCQPFSQSDDDNEQTESDNDGDDFLHPKLCTFDEEERRDEKQDDEEEEEGRDTEMIDASLTNVQATQVIEDTHVIMTAVTLEAQQQSSSVSSSFISNMLNPNPDTCICSILNLNTESTSLVDVPVTTNLEMPPSSVTTLPPPHIPFIQPQQQTPVPPPAIVPSSSLQNLSTFAKTSHAVAANLSELELKKILIDKMESNKRRDDEDDDEEPSAGSNRGSKRRRARKEPESTRELKEKTSKSTSKSTEGFKSHEKSTGKSTQVDEPIHTVDDLEEPAPQEFNTGFTEDQPVEEASQLPDCNLAWKDDSCYTFNEPMDTPLDFSSFMMNRLKVDTLTLELLAGPTFELMKGSCKSLVELEYFLEEVYKATTDQLDWNNPEGWQYPHDLHKPLPLIPNSQGRRVIPFDHFINNDLAYLRSGVSSRTYATSMTKTKAANNLPQCRGYPLKDLILYLDILVCLTTSCGG
nr:hypothetical protein [Tanacetum cinerariifolium]